MHYKGRSAITNPIVESPQTNVDNKLKCCSIRDPGGERSIPRMGMCRRQELQLQERSQSYTRTTLGISVGIIRCSNSLTCDIMEVNSVSRISWSLDRRDKIRPGYVRRIICWSCSEETYRSEWYRRMIQVSIILRGRKYWTLLDWPSVLQSWGASEFKGGCIFMASKPTPKHNWGGKRKPPGPDPKQHIQPYSLLVRILGYCHSSRTRGKGYCQLYWKGEVSSFMILLHEHT